MSAPNLDDDEVLLAHLGPAIDDDDPIPPAATALAIAGFELRRLDEALAEMVADSSVAAEVVLRRESSATRVLRFVAPHLTVEVELDEETSQATGVVSPAAAIRIEVETVSTGVPPQRESVESDELGRFQVLIRPGLSRLHCYAAPEVSTPWFTR